MKGQQRAGWAAPSHAVPSVVVLALTLLLAACSREAGDWRTAQGTDTIEAYERFIAQYPQSEFAAQARERTRQLAEERDWQAASSADTADAYQQFLGQYPDGKWAQEARVRIENFNVLEGMPPSPASTASSAATEPAAPASRAGAAALPAAAAAAPPFPPPAANGTHRVQLGAFSTEAKAHEAWRQASARFAALRPLTPQVAATTRGDARLYRLQTSLRSEAEARDLCRTLQAGGQACMYVPSQ